MKPLTYRPVWTGYILVLIVGVAAIYLGPGRLPGPVIAILALPFIPLLAGLMSYLQNIYLTPAITDFPWLFPVYPLYLLLLFSPLFMVVHRRRVYGDVGKQKERQTAA